MLCAFLLKYLEALKKLLSCEAVLSLTRVVHYLSFYLEMSARIETAADSFRNTAKVVKIIYVSEIVKVDISAKLSCLEKIRLWSNV